MKTIIKSLLFSIIIGSSSVTFAQVGTHTPITTDPGVKIGKLPNGLTYYIRKNSKPAKKVELRLAVNTGSILEDESQQGLAHFMEHMGFNGSKNFPKNELVNYLEQVGVKFGADLNAFTSFDETVYILPISTEKPEVVDKGFTVLEDWAFNNLFDENEIEKERGVVLEESRLSKGAGDRLTKVYLPMLLNGSDYAKRLPIGKDSILKTFKPETLRNFYKKWYRPDLMSVVVVGDIEPAEAERLITAHFGKFQQPVSAAPRPALITVKERTKPEAIVLTDDELTGTGIQIYNYIKPAKPVTTWEDYRQKVIGGLMITMINNRLQEVSQKESPPFNYAYTSIGSLVRGYETFTSYAQIGNNTVTQAVDALVSETERAKQFGFLPSELERAKKNLLSQTEKEYAERDKTESGQLVWDYVYNFLQKTPIPGIESRYDFIAKILPGVKLDELNAMAKKMPSTANSFTMVTAPTAKKAELPSNEALLKAVIAANNNKVTPYTEKAISAKLLEKELIAGKTLKVTQNVRLGTTDLTLNNGVSVTLKPTKLKNDEVSMDAWRWGGLNKFSLADRDQARYTTAVVGAMGVGKFSPTDLTKYLSGKSVYVSPYLNGDEDGVEGECNAKDVEEFLQLTHLYLTSPRKDEALFNSFVTKQAASVKFLKQSPSYVFSDTINKMLYNNNPWMVNTLTEKTFTSLNADKVLDIYKGVFGNMYGMHFTFVGNIDVEKFTPLLEKYLGSLPSSPMEPSYKDNGVRPVKGVVEASIYKGKDPKSIIRVAFTGTATDDPGDRLKLRALMDVLNMKVIEKLREEMGGIYGGGFNGSIIVRPYLHYVINASIPCGPENVDKLSIALFALMKSVRETGIDQKDLDKVKETYNKEYDTNIQDNNFWLRSLSSHWIDRRDPEEMLTYKQEVAALTTEDVKAAAKKYLTPGNYVKAVLYPEKAN